MDDFLDVVLYEDLGAGKRVTIQARPAHASHIAVYALVQGIQQPAMIVPGLQAAQAVQACAYGNVIVLLAVVTSAASGPAPLRLS